MSAEQSYDPAPPPDPTQFGDLANKRGAFLKELDSDPRLMLRLTNSAYREVHDQSPRAWQAYLETVMNRAIARKQTLNDTIYSLRDPKQGQHGYYPHSTFDHLDDPLTKETQAFQKNLSPILHTVFGGSNISQQATGNQSEQVKSGGAQINIPRETPNADDFIVELPDVDWNKESRQLQDKWDTQGQPTTPDVGPVNALKYVPDEPVAPRARPASAPPPVRRALPVTQTDTDDTTDGYASDPVFQWPDA